MALDRRDPATLALRRERECGTKQPLDRALAEKRAATIRKLDRGNGLCVAYECPWCRKWHVGHRRER